ncbi:MAG: DUF58 domain-containing protein [Planctomycetota bacterium]
MPGPDVTADSLVDAELLARVGHLELFARGPMIGSVSGRHQSPHKGSSVEFAEYRAYEPGDDLRRLDWRAWGRSDRFFVKEFEADTNLRLVAVVDASGSMRYAGPGGRSKLDVARRLVATLAQIALRQGDAAGLWIAGGGEAASVPLPPRRRPSHLRAIAATLASVEASGETSLAETLHAAAEREQRRALFVVVSDLFAPSDALGDAFQHLAHRRHDVTAIQLLDRTETEFPFDRPTRFVDAEGGASIVADPSTIARRYHAALDRHMARLDEIARQARLDLRRVHLDDDLGTVLTELLAARVGRRGQR